MSLLVVGLSHRSAPVSVLERAALPADTQAKLLQDALAAEPAAEAAVLATCNRIELYADVDKFHAGVAELSTLLAQHSGVGLEELTPYLYVHYEDRAVHHLFSVACGLDSMVVGEGQILGQIKDALARAQELHTPQRGAVSGSAGGSARAHSETARHDFGRTARTFASGRDLGGRPARPCPARRVRSRARAGVEEVVVANRTLERAERLAAILSEQGGTGVSARAVPMDQVAHELTRADVAVSCTGATGLVLTADAVAAAVEGRVPADSRPGDVPAQSRSGSAGQAAQPTVADDGCPVDLTAAPRGFSVAGEAAVAGMDAASLEQHAAWVDNAPAERRDTAADPRAEADAIAALVAAASVTGRLPERRKPVSFVGAARPAVLALLDLAMPRDIDAAVHRIPGVRLVDIESLAEASADAPMAADVEQVRGIVSDEVAAFGAAQRAAHITPTVVALRTMAADVVASEIARLDGRLPGLEDKQRAEITQTVRRVVDKLLHAPTVRVKQLGRVAGARWSDADALRTLLTDATDATDVNGENHQVTREPPELTTANRPAGHVRRPEATTNAATTANGPVGPSG
ncbi:glutamyl-tRNA reductase [Streptomyces sp. 135]|uniref:glutamyl-tRNA reductase n=1 Tax=Streptomyces sp. 135 TaxID=2838850 RepID=UPI001CBBD5E1|nr:glutamyl-tRNA reductase [Streptomyces sp. 135]